VRCLTDPERSSSCRPWLFGIARNLLADERGRAGRSAALAARLSPQAFGDDAIDASIDALDATDRWSEVAAALSRLDDDTRELLLIVAWDRLTYGEAAEVLGIPVGTVRSRISRARAHLSRLVSERTPCHD